MSGGVKQLKDEGSQIQSVMAGGIAGMVSRFAIAPLDVIKIRLQLQTHSRFNPHAQATSGPVYDGALGTLKHILRHEGITGLWKGNIPAELMYICYGAIQFSAYRYSSHFLSSLPPPYRPSDTSTSFLSGAVAGTLATTTTYPLDLLRTRFAAQGTDRVYASIWSSIREIMSSEGYQGFFRGLTAGVGQIIPYMGLFFASYEAMKLPMANLDLPWGSGDAAAGLTASVLSKTAVYPLDTVRKRLQVQGPTRERYVNRNIPVYQGIGRSIRDIVKNEGPRGMYRGLTVSLLKAAPASAVTVWTYERAINVLQKMGEALADDD